MALTPKQKRAVWKSFSRLLISAAVCVLALWYNKPFAKDLTFDVVSQGFVTPVPLTLKLHYGATELRSATANGFDAAVSNVAEAKFSQDSQALRSVAPPSAFSLARSPDPNQTPPHLEVTPQGAVGKMELRIGAGVLLRSTGAPGQMPTLSVESASQGDIHLLLVTDSVELNGNRYLFPEILSAGSLVNSFKAEASGEFPGVAVDLSSGPPPPTDPDLREPARPSLRLTFNLSAGQLPLLPEAIRKRDEIQLTSASAGGAVSLIFTGAVNPDLRLKDQTVSGVLPDRKVDLRVEASSGSINAIGIDGIPEKRNAPTLNVKGSARARSLRQDGRELLPTVIEEALSEPYSTRSPLLVLLGFAVFGLLKLVDRAFGVLLEAYLPKED